jgi:hypothetical protein
MARQDFHPQIIAVAVVVTGALFLVACLQGLPFLTPEAPGAYWLAALSIVFIISGILFLVSARRGGLNPRGETVAEVRMQAVEKMQSKELLSRIVLEDDDEMVRDKAARRLEEITD